LPKIIATALLVLLALTVAGCTKKVEPIRVKCPACGYEFDVQPEGWDCFYCRTQQMKIKGCLEQTW